MSETSRTKVIKIGNSRGIRIPKAVLERLHLTDAVELVVKEDHLEVRPGRKPREGWAEAFAEMAARGETTSSTNRPRPRGTKRNGNGSRAELSS